MMKSYAVSIESLPDALTDVHTYWTSIKQNRLAPSWTTFDLSALPPRLVPTTMVIDICDPFESNRFRFWGTGLTEVHGVEMTGKCPYDLQPPALGARLMVEHRAVFETQKPSARHLSFTTGRGYQHSHTLLRLPLSDDGVAVDHIVGIVDYSPDAIRHFQQSGETYADVYSAVDQKDGEHSDG